MTGQKAFTLLKNQIIDGRYTISFFIKKGKYAESYRVRTDEGKIKFLKLFNFAKLHRTQFTTDGEILEIQILKQLNHPNLVKFYDCGELLLENAKCAYLIMDFISGETLSDKMRRDGTLKKYEAKSIILSILNGLNYLHNLEKPIIHNNICNTNVMLDFSGKTPIAKIIDFGSSRYLYQSGKDFSQGGINPFYHADEAFNNVFSPQTDVFSVGALYFHMLTGLPPWFIDISKYKSEKIVLADAILDERKKPLRFPNEIDELTKNIIIKALHHDVDERFKNTKEFIRTINGEQQIKNLSETPASKKIKKQKPKSGKGFAAIAGMEKLKELMRVDVIDALNEKEKYAKYGLTIPNGVLFYGPPGCGKTFFAERLSEEIGFTFYHIKPSDVQSKWVNASQENVKNLFDEAKKNAPSIVFIDELDALLPNRDNSSVNHMNTAVVNEFLAQMNNCGDEGIFVIGATNRPDAIDPAIMRAGRLDKHIYIPLPDFEARKQLFKLYMRNRPTELGINYNELANLTENYVSGDIKFLCDEAARQALKLNTRISFDIITNTIKNNKPSTTVINLKRYEQIYAKIEGLDIRNNDRPRVGFVNN